MKDINVVVDGIPCCFREKLWIDRGVYRAEELLNGKVGKVKDFVTKNVKYTLDANGAEERSRQIAKIKESWKRMRRLSHPHVLSCVSAELNWDQDDPLILKTSYLMGTQIMEYSPEGDLAFYMKARGCLDVCEVQHYSHQLLQGIHYLHASFMVHGDLKPQNILVFPESSMRYGVCLKIADLDYHTALSKSKTQTGHDASSVDRSPQYQSPEMLTQTKIGRGTDIWSYGCLVLVMLTGKEFLFIGPQPECILAHFSDPFDPEMKKLGYWEMNRADAANRKKPSVPVVPENYKRNFECRNFLKACLTVDPARRARTQALFKEPWLSKEHSLWNGTENSRSIMEVLLCRKRNKINDIYLHRHESWSPTADDVDDEEDFSERQWRRGMECGRFLLMHFLRRADYSPHAYDTAAGNLSATLRECPFRSDQLDMYRNYLSSSAFNAALTESEQKTRLADLKFWSDYTKLMLRKCFPVYLSFGTLAQFLNNLNQSAGSRHTYEVRSSADWIFVQNLLDKGHPVICQLSDNEIDQNATILTQADINRTASVCPRKLIELDTVVVTGYKSYQREKNLRETVVILTKANGLTIDKKLEDFERLWRWEASDPLMRLYLNSEDIHPSSALYQN
ncbi:uncharacterized protein LOC129584354 [Paramacrobiotus metropolitanus]|uniref:uncharacterized protein LOC129584354 n=1 Tax=Paramacrobiotus metropolitanus TaxID=2943436 RepID=UPI0024463774|nr:uncharacterized protein LOC129584354 [Paramacrobiotus metropolitanus]XP_055332486.1 uncharacterized protein LOC129584354 [Paramacrobiotus metropolitanus]